MDIVQGVINEIWTILVESSLYMLIGFFLSGLIYIYISTERIVKYFGRGKVRSVLMASLLGVPLPLCSCGVLPAAATIRKKGANKGALLSFLISTPESGVTSIAMTYALMDGVMAAIRPIAAFITATVAGLVENFTGKFEEPDVKDTSDECIVDSCCSGEDCPEEEHRHHHNFFDKFKAGMNFSFGELIDDISKWFMLGLIMAGIVSYFIPSGLVSNYLGPSISSKLVMLFIGVPIYICASASTPLVAALMIKGMSPGTAVVFLMAGPATNIAAIPIVSKLIGKKATGIYLASIAVCSVVIGVIVDWIYVSYALSTIPKFAHHHESHTTAFHVLAAVLMVALVAKGIYKKGLFPKKHKGEAGDSCCSSEEKVEVASCCSTPEPKTSSCCSTPEVKESSCCSTPEEKKSSCCETKDEPCEKKEESSKSSCCGSKKGGSDCC